MSLDCFWGSRVIFVIRRLWSAFVPSEIDLSSLLKIEVSFCLDWDRLPGGFSAFPLDALGCLVILRVCSVWCHGGSFLIFFVRAVSFLTLRPFFGVVR